jgi:tripartite-type tricarboxylate transporter receptor subunit TctC
VFQRSRALACALISGTLLQYALAQDAYPSKPVRVMVPFAAGGGTDIAARLLANKLTESLGQSFLIDNRGGASGNIGTEAVAKAAPDGYTLLMAYASHATNVPLFAKLPFDAIRDFAPISMVAAVPNMLVVHPSVAATTVEALVELAKTQPGKLNYGSSGPGTPPHLTGELFKSMAGVNVTHIPYKGVAQSLNAQLANDVQITFPTVLSAFSNIQSGKLRALAVTSLKRAPTLPDVPTMDEAGLRGFESVSWYGLLAPAATPRPIIAKLHAEVVKVLNQSDLRDQLLKQGAEPVGSTPDEFARRIAADIDKWGKLIRSAGIRAE